MEPINKKWKVIYPIYLDKNVSLATGRRVSASHSVEAPKLDEIVSVLSYLNIPHRVEPEKRHPADPFVYGRVRFCLRDEKGGLLNPEITNRAKLFAKIGQLIANLKSRTDGNQNQGDKGKKKGKK